MGAVSLAVMDKPRYKNTHDIRKAQIRKTKNPYKESVPMLRKSKGIMFSNLSFFKFSSIFFYAIYA